MYLPIKHRDFPAGHVCLLGRYQRVERNLYLFFEYFVELLPIAVFIYVIYKQHSYTSIK